MYNSELAMFVQCSDVLLQSFPQDALMVENMHDVPYTVCPGPEVTAAMAVLGAALRQSCPRVPLGVQVLCAANRQAIAIALAAGKGKGSSGVPAALWCSFPTSCTLC